MNFFKKMMRSSTDDTSSTGRGSIDSLDDQIPKVEKDKNPSIKIEEILQEKKPAKTESAPNFREIEQDDENKMRLPGGLRTFSALKLGNLSNSCQIGMADRGSMGLGGMGLSQQQQQQEEERPQENNRPNRNRGDSYNVPELLRKAEINSGMITVKGIKTKAHVQQLKTIADIGHGSCGTVTKCDYEGVVMAVKTMPRTTNTYEMSRILMDLDVICLSIDCPYIVRCFGYFITQNDVRVCMECMATCLDRLLNHIQGPIPEPIIGKLCVSIIKALNYLKTTHKIMHRDVKPSNILLDWNGAIKLCDFGIAGRLIESRAHSKSAGCPLYMGPERLDPTNLMSYDIRSDVWSLGLTLVELATGKYPYAGSEFDMMSNILKGEPPQLSPSQGFSHDFCDLVNSCLQREPTRRPNYDILLEHPFIVQHEQAPTNVEEWFADVMGV